MSSIKRSVDEVATERVSKPTRKLRAAHLRWLLPAGGRVAPPPPRIARLVVAVTPADQLPIDGATMR